MVGLLLSELLMEFFQAHADAGFDGPQGYTEHFCDLTKFEPRVHMERNGFALLDG
jgi:hypothetical protein